jgi:hypothetical protein
MMSALALLVTGWVVSDNPPGSATSWAPGVFVVVGLLGGVLVTALDLQEGEPQAAVYLRDALLWHLLPFGLIVWGAAAWMEGTAYDALAGWSWWTLAGCAAATLVGALYRLVSAKQPRAGG